MDHDEARAGQSVMATLHHELKRKPCALELLNIIVICGSVNLATCLCVCEGIRANSSILAWGCFLLTPHNVPMKALLISQGASTLQS